MNFFWVYFQRNKHLRPISWHKICKPFEQGGLNIWTIESSARAALLRQVWNFNPGKNCLWTEWVTKKYLKNKNFWDLKAGSCTSWGWRGILQSWKDALPFFHHLIGDGEKTRFWLDPWLPCGRLLDKFGPRPAYDLGFDLDVKVSRFITNGSWNVPSTISNELLEIY